jgi:carbon-monoxide dehydrogenase iron sulfur subunit
MTRIKYIQWNAEVCTGCRLCELACSFRNGTEIAPSTAAIRLEEDTIHVCRQCETPACAQACRFDAMKEELDPEKCTGCGLCISACPHHSIFQPYPKAPPVRCNTCGGNPECVRICPNGALKLTRKGRLAVVTNRLQLTYRRYSNELFLYGVTRMNHRITMMARKHLICIREGRPDTLINRLLLAILAKTFKKNFAASENKI